MRNTRWNLTPTRPPDWLADWLAARRAFALAALFPATALACIAASAISASAQTEPSPIASPRPACSAVSENVALPQNKALLYLPDAPGNSAAGAIGALASSSASEAFAAPPGQNSAQNVATALSPPEQGTASLPEAPRSQRYPLPGQPAPVLTSGDKVRMGFTGAFSFYSILGWVTSAGYEQVTDGSPNFGTDRGAFGQRLWASAARATSENLLSDSVFAPIFHEDPRYYRLGSTHNPFSRLVYSATRSIITRSDSGGTVPNLSQIVGNAAGSALTNAYYPQSNINAKDTMETFAGSLGGTALGDVLAEFFGGVLFNHSH
jgi:hypothetical protein